LEQRKTRRFTLQLPLALTRAGSLRLADAGLTKNISSCGVLFTAERELDVGGPIEYIITLIDQSSNAVNLRCVGKVVRQEKVDDSPNHPVTVAATMERYEFVRNS
jgi:PilZ domain-containing protein